MPHFLLLAACAMVASSPALGSALPTIMEAALARHNVYRCMHGLELFTWDAEVAAKAQAWADNDESRPGDAGGVGMKHSTAAFRELADGTAVGENLFRGAGDGVMATQMWYEEIEDTPNGAGLVTEFPTDPNHPPIGHYTQVVWTDSVRLGCATSGNLWVCQYAPAGNYIGQLASKVTAPVKTEDECAPPDSVCTLPSCCTPSPRLPNGGLCVYGFQCASSFCCPRLKVCLASSSSSVSTNDIKVALDYKPQVIDMVFGGGSCRSPWDHGSSCMCDQDGRPLSTWDQSKCGCEAFYFDRYTSETWLALNDIPGMTCEAPTPEETRADGNSSSNSLAGAAHSAPRIAASAAIAGAAALACAL